MNKLVIFFSLVFFALFSVAANAPDPKNTNFSPNPYLVAEYMSHFETIGDYLTNLKDDKQITEFEYSSITQTIKEHKVSLQEKIGSIKIEGHQIKFGKKVLSVEANDVFKTQDGVYIRLSDSSSADKVFTKTLKAFSNQKTSLFKSLILEDANAQNLPAGLEAIKAGLFTVGHAGAKAFWNAMYLVGGTAFNAVGIIGETVVVGLGNLIYKGTVSCSGDRYEYHSGYVGTDWKKDYDKAFEEDQKWKKKRYYNDSVLNSYYSQLDGYLGAGVLMFANIFGPQKNDTTYIKDEFLSQIFNTKIIPKCNPANAAKVQADLKEKAKKIKENIVYTVKNISTQEAKAKAKSEQNNR